MSSNVCGTTALKSTAEWSGASPEFELAEKTDAEQANKDQIDGDDNVEKPRNDKNKNTGDKCDNRLQMRNTDGHDVLPY
jgi:hypothetical protein